MSAQRECATCGKPFSTIQNRRECYACIRLEAGFPPDDVPEGWTVTQAAQHVRAINRAASMWFGVVDGGFEGRARL